MSQRININNNITSKNNEILKKSQEMKQNDNANINDDDENIQNTEPEQYNNNINPSQKQIQKFNIINDSSKNNNNNNNNNANNKRIIEFNFLQNSQENIDDDEYNLDDNNNNNIENNLMMNNININDNYNNNNNNDYRIDDTDGNHKFMTEQSIQQFYKTILERLSTQDQSYSKWQKESKKQQGIKFSADFRNLYADNAIGSEYIFMNNISIKYNHQKICFNLIENNNTNSKDNTNNNNNDKDWRKPILKNDLNSDGLSLVNKIIKFTCNLNQRSLTTILTTQFRLRGNSQFNIILRSIDLENEESCLLRFIKEGYGYDMRLFILLGRYDKTNDEYLFIKKCEVPLIKISDEHAISDYLDCDCKIVDIGNDCLNLKAQVNGNIQEPFKIQYKQSIMPIFDNFNIFFVGQGEDLAVSRAHIQQIDRISYINRKNNFCSYNTPKCNCNIVQAQFSG